MDVFQIIITGQKTGVLTVEGPSARARVFFELGRLQSAHMQPGVHLGEILVRMDYLTAREVQEILAEQRAENAGTPLGLAALKKALIEGADLRRALEAQAIEIIGELMLWKAGQFSFSERSATASQVPTEESLDAMNLLMEAVRRLDSWRQGAVGPNEVYEKAADPTKYSLPKGGWDVLQAVDGRRSARAVAAELDMGDKQVYHVMYELKERGVIRPALFQLEDPTVLVVSPSSALQRLIHLSLQRASLRPEVVSGYAEGLDCLAERHPQAVVVDDEGGGAWDFVRELRRRPGQSHLPVLLLSAEPEGGFLSRLRRPKATVLAKPFHELELQEAVNTLLGRSP